MMSEFKEFRLCDGSWKLDRLAARVYASWRQNIRRYEHDVGTHSNKRERLTWPHPGDSDDSTPETALLAADVPPAIVTVARSLTDGPPGRAVSVLGQKAQAIVWS
jgi:hypothetical protein